MKKIKKIISLLLVCVLLVGCSNMQGVQTNSSGKVSIVAASFHEYDWVLQILGENASEYEVTLLMDDGIDMHSYEPSVEEIALIKSADLVVYNGGPSLTWLDELLDDTDIESINMINELGGNVINEVRVDGMQETEHAHDEDCCTEDEHTHDHDDEVIEVGHVDEHVWLSFENAIESCKLIEEKISAIDPDNAELYQENLDNYIAEIEELDQKYIDVIDNANRDTVLFADRFPFLYLLGGYDINYYAAFQGCSAETEASFETVAFLSSKVDELDLDYVFIIDNGQVDLANTIIDNSSNNDAEVLVLDSMQSVSSDKVDSGATYLSIMEENLNTLEKALK